MSADTGLCPLLVTALDPPFTTELQVLFGLQNGKVVDRPMPAVTSASFEAQIELVLGGPEPDFKGGFVHGKRGDRFLYLSWGVADGVEPFAMFARAKIKLATIPVELLAAVGDGVGLECEFEATNSKGQPTSGTIKPSEISWNLRNN